MKKRIRTFDPPDIPMARENDSHNPQSLELSEGQFEAHFRRLNLAHMRRIYREVAARAEKESWSYRDFLALLLAEEVARRKQTRLQRCTRNAHFPFFKTIEEFDFTLQSTLRESVIGSYLGLDFVTEGRSLILHGKTGRGKTHLAVAIGYRAIQNGFETLFTTAAELIEDLSNASKRGHLQESLETYTHPHILVIDEVGYLTYGPDAANVLFHVVNDRHLRKRPMIFTTNKPLTEWGKVLHDEDMAAAILDRVLERGRFIHLDGPSGRTRHLNLEEILPAGTDRARISGIGVPEFPEPTLEMVPRDLEVTEAEKQGLAQQKIIKELTGVFWEAVDRNENLRAHKDHFYSNGIVYSTSIDVFLICGFMSFVYATAAVIQMRSDLAYVGAFLIAIARTSRYFITPRKRMRHLELSAEQLEILRAEESEFVSNRFREIIWEWRRVKSF